MFYHVWQENAQQKRTRFLLKYLYHYQNPEGDETLKVYRWLDTQAVVTNNWKHRSRQYIGTVHRRLVTPKSSDCKGILPKMALIQTKDV